MTKPKTKNPPNRCLGKCFRTKKTMGGKRHQSFYPSTEPAIPIKKQLCQSALLTLIFHHFLVCTTSSLKTSLYQISWKQPQDSYPVSRLNWDHQWKNVITDFQIMKFNCANLHLFCTVQKGGTLHFVQNTRYLGNLQITGQTHDHPNCYDYSQGIAMRSHSLFFFLK